MDPEQPGRGRSIVAAAVLATVGLGCVGAILVILTLLGLGIGDYAAGDRGISDVLGILALALRSVPALAWVMVVAAVGLHSGTRAGRALALGVAVVLAASVPALLLAGQRPWPDPVANLMYHLFLIPGPGSALVLADIGLASTVAWAAITATPAPAPGPAAYRGVRSAPRPRSVTYLAAGLALVAIYALIPLVVLLVAVVAPEEEGGLGHVGLAHGVVLVASCVAIAGLALGAALALATGRRLGLLISLPAAVIGGVWGGLWGLALLSRLLSAIAVDDAAYALGTPLLLVTSALVFGFSVLALVIPVRTQAWFEPAVDGTAAESRPRAGGGRPWRWILGTLLAEVAAVAVLASIPTEVEPIPLRAPGALPETVRFRGQDYGEMAWADLMASSLEPIDGVDLFDEADATVPPIAYRLQDIPSDALIVLEPGDVVSEATLLHVALFTPAGDTTEFVDLPASVCPMVDLTTTLRGRCAAPERMVYEDHWYQRDLALLVPPNHFAGGVGSARFDPPAGSHVPSEIRMIEGVDPGIAVAVATPTGGIVYRALAHVDERVDVLCQYVRDDVDGALGCQ